MTTAIFTMEQADPTIPWPARGSAEKVLCEREGWERRIIPTRLNGEPSSIEAMCRGELAVNLMVDSEGFTISLADTGWRICSGGRVFARCVDAMKVAEEMAAVCTDWAACVHFGYTDTQRCVLIGLTDAAEERGEILLDRVYPF